MAPGTVAGRLIGLLARAFPGDAVERTELVAVFERAYRRRARRGRIGAWAYAVRTAVDVVRAGWRERRRQRWRGAADRAGGGAGDSNGGGGGMGRFAWEVRYALRVLGRSPVFTLTAVAILALGIGGNAAVFSALKTVLLDPPPYPEPGRLVFADIVRGRVGQPDTTTFTFSWAKLRRLREGTADVFGRVSGYAERSVTLSEPGDAERVSAETVEPDYFALLGVEPVVGRTFAASEGGDDPSGVVVLGHELWSERFAGDPEVLGREVVLAGGRFQVVGVAPWGFRGLTGTADLWMTIGDLSTTGSGWLLDEPQAHWLHVIARLRGGVTVEDARVRMARVGDAIEAELPMADPGEWVGGGLRTLAEVRDNPGARMSVLVLIAAAGLVLLIAVANLAGLLIARGTRRRRETAVRLALGSGKVGLLRGLVIETLLLAAAGGLVGLGVAWLGIRGIAAAWPAEFVTSADSEMVVVDVTRLSLDGGVLLFSAALTLAAGLLFGVLPALRQSGLDLVPALKDGSRGPRRGDGGLAARRFLVGAQAAVAVVLLVGAGLMAGTLLSLRSVDRGFDPERLLVLRYNTARVAGVTDRWGFHRSLLERVRALPAVEGATLTTSAPLSGWNMRTRVRGREGAPPYENADRPEIGVLLVTPDYFDVLGASLTSGRTFESDELEAPPRTALLNRTAAETLFGQEDPLGRTFEMGVSFEGNSGSYRVVGIVDDVLQSAPDRDRLPTAYLPLPAGDIAGVTALIRTRGDPFDVVPAVRDVMRSLDASIPLFGITTARELDARAVGDTRVLLGLLTIFAAVALTLAATGVYGVVAYSVANRRPELGLRMALGARRSQVSGMVLREGVTAAGIGVAVGLVVALAGTRLLSTFLWGVGERDPGAFAVGALVLLAVAAVASWLPARRATVVEPAEVLRSE
ncbi:MAG: ADOP family duplicated permease [Gemmatimonadota bacterium]